MTHSKFPKAMLADLKRSGLGPKDAEALRLEYSEGDHPGYAIPYCGLDGKPTGHFRRRLLGPESNLPRDKKGRSMRYTQPAGYPPRFYYAHLGGVKWKAVASDPTVPVYVTEGEKKAASVCALGVPCIGLGGVWNWLTEHRAIDDFGDINWQGRRVSIVFDSDIRHKEPVRIALKRLADETIKRGAIPSEIILPDGRSGKTGVDDYLVAHGSGERALAKLRALPERPLLIPAGMTFADLAVARIPEPRWVVEGLIPTGLTILAGKPKVGKSWLTLDLSIAVATGTRALGAYAVPKRGGVIHLALEDTRRRFQDRIKRVLGGASAPATAHFYNDWPRVEVHGLTALRRWLDTHRDTLLVIIDTFAKMRASPSRDDTLYLADYAAVEQLKAIADDYAVAVVVVHHERKAAASDHLDRVSGSTGLTGAADTILTLGRERVAVDAILAITGRDVDEDEIALALDKATMRWAAKGPAADYRMGQERRAVVDAMSQLGRPATPSEVAALLGRERRGVNKLMLTMATQGQLEWLPDKKYQLAPSGRGNV
jgi:hypothetical protein